MNYKTFSRTFLCLTSVILETTGITQNKYTSQPLTHQEYGLTYKKIEGRKSRLQWAALCSKYDACRSFYVDDGACVFGLSYNVTEFANGDDVTPADGQMLMTKRLYRNLSSKRPGSWGVCLCGRGRILESNIK